MSKRSYKESLDELALGCGIEPEYRDNWGHIRRTSTDTKKSILQAMGITVGTESRAIAAWHARDGSARTRLTDPTIIATPSSLPETLNVRIPQKAQRAEENAFCRDWEASLEIADESGAVIQHLSFTPLTVSHIEPIRTGHVTYDCWRLPFPQLPALGYYRFHLSVKVNGQNCTEAIFVAICPDKAYIPPALQGEKRVAGIQISLYGIRSEQNWGIGDFGDLIDVVDWVAEDLHGNVLGLNPLHATANRSPYNTSPYFPLSRFYRNFVYLDVPSMIDVQESPEAQILVKAPTTQRLLADLRASPTVQYEEVAALKESVLRRAFETFLSNHWSSEDRKTERQKAFESFIESEGSLLDHFAAFCALDSTMRSSSSNAWTWQAWPRSYRRPDTNAVEDFGKEQWREILFHKWVQWQLEEQLKAVQAHAKNRGMSIGLYHDLALGADPSSADLWANQDYFFSGLRVGAPPDAFSQQGQDWGVPPPNMEAFQGTGYDLFIKEVQKNCRFGGALRIDHVMRFFRLFCIPEGHSAAEGAYLKQPFEDLLRIVCLESLRNEVLIVGEDLGTVPEYVRDRLQAMDILSYKLLYFERDDEQGFVLPQDYPELALVTITTHDLPTLAGFWIHEDIKVRQETDMFENHEAAVEAAREREADKQRLLSRLDELGLLPEHSDRDARAYPEVTGELHHAVVSFLAHTPAKIFMVTQEDLLKECDQQNLPGSTVEYPNWSLKMKYTVEDLRTDPEAAAFCRMFRDVVDRSGRS